MTQDEWLVKLREDQRHGHLDLPAVAHMLALRDERIATLDATLLALIPPRTRPT